MSSECLEEQLQELEALESVFDEGGERVVFSQEDGRVKGRIVVEFEPLAQKSSLCATVNGVRKCVKVSVLPSATLHFDLPPDYPTSSSPELSLECIWMSQEMLDSFSELLRTQSESMAGMPVLFFCLQSVVDSVRDQEDWLREICIDSTPWVLSKSISGQEVLKLVTESSEKSEDHNFEAGCYDCEVCFENKSGKDSVKITPCDHVFCAECVRMYITEKTRGSQIQAIVCLDSSCDSPIPQTVIKNAIGEEEFNRYERILLESALCQMSDVVPCPRPSCQKSVVLSQQNPSLGVCEACGLSFCALCKRTYHGLEECKFSAVSGDRKSIVEEFEEKNDEERKEMAKRFGGFKNLQRIVDSIRNESWIDGNSKPCPRCKVSIEKNDGCNKMHCLKCDANFCWLCNQILSPTDPYAHFNGLGACANLLFEGVAEDDMDEDFWAEDGESTSSGDSSVFTLSDVDEDDEDIVEFGA